MLIQSELIELRGLQGLLEVSLLVLVDLSILRGLCLFLLVYPVALLLIGSSHLVATLVH
jgi:hypothetical protein